MEAKHKLLRVVMTGKRLMTPMSFRSFAWNNNNYNTNNNYGYGNGFNQGDNSGGYQKQ
jgi:hypothetical protein